MPVPRNTSNSARSTSRVPAAWRMALSIFSAGIVSGTTNARSRSVDREAARRLPLRRSSARPPAAGTGRARATPRARSPRTRRSTSGWISPTAPTTSLPERQRRRSCGVHPGRHAATDRPGRRSPSPWRSRATAPSPRGRRRRRARRTVPRTPAAARSSGHRAGRRGRSRTAAHPVRRCDSLNAIGLEHPDPHRRSEHVLVGRRAGS